MRIGSFKRFWRLALIVPVAAALAMTSSAGPVPSARAQDETESAMDIRFSDDTPLIAPAIACKDSQYKIVVRTAERINGSWAKVNSGIEADAALNPLSPNYVEASADGMLPIFVYNANNVGHEIIGITAYEKKVLSPDGGVQAEIGHGSLEFDVKECAYTVDMVYSFQFPLGTVFGFMAHNRLVKDSSESKDGSKNYVGEGPFKFTQMVNTPPCVAEFKDVTVATKVTGTIEKALDNTLKLKFDYSDAQTSITATCPIVGTRSASKTISGSTLGVTSASFPEQGGSASYPALGGILTIYVAREIR